MTQKQSSAFRDGEEKYRLIVDSARDFAIFTVDKRNRVTSWNSGAANVLGYSEKEILQKSATRLFTPADRKRKAPEKEIRTAAQCGRAEDQRWHLKRDGTRIWGSGLMMPLMGPDNQVIGYLKILRDMTREKFAELAKERLRMMVENIRDYAIIFLDSRGHINEWNEGAARLKGYSASEVIGRHFRIFYTKEDRKNKLPEYELRTAIEVGRSEVEGWRVRKDGSRFWVNEIVTPIYDRSKVLIGFAKISRDLTERREAEEALRMMNDSLERRVQERTAEMEDYQSRLRSLALQLSRTQEDERQRIAADLHDNLAQLLALSEMRLSVLKKHLTDPLALKSVSDIEKYTDQAIKYTRTLMTDLSPPVLQRRELLPALQWLAQEMETHGLKTTVHHGKQQTNVSDEVFTVLFQGVRELLFNVLKHAETDKASMSLKASRSVVIIRVHDHGKGFDPKATRLNKRAFGLFTLGERLRLLGGQLELTSATGKGTEAIITVPAHIGKPIQRPLVPPQKPFFGFHREPPSIRILIVDDQKMMRDGLRKIVEEEAGIEIVGEAINGDMAILMSRKLKPDVVLMDVNMPKTDGIEATRRITRSKNAPAVIGLSIHEDAQTAQDMKRAGASDYLSKRDTADRLYSTIRRWARGLKKKKLKRE